MRLGGLRGLGGRVRGLGRAFVGVLHAELQALVSDVAESGRGLVRSVLLFAAGFAFAFWTLGLLVYFLIELLALRLPRWGAVGVVFAIFLATAVGLLVASRNRLRRIESPAKTFERRLRAHRAWWEERVLPEVEGATGGVGRGRRIADDDPDDDLDFDDDRP